MNKLEDWLLNIFVGKVVARTAVMLAGYVAGPVVQSLAGKAGVSVSVDPLKLQAAMMIALQIGFEYFKARRMANPNSPAVQTDSSKVGVPLPNQP